jgi:hypothetical protein
VLHFGPRRRAPYLPRFFHEADGRRTPDDVDRNILSTPLSDFRLCLKSVILDVGEEMTRDSRAVIVCLVCCNSSIWVWEVDNRLGVRQSC